MTAETRALGTADGSQQTLLILLIAMHARCEWAQPCEAVLCQEAGGTFRAACLIACFFRGSTGLRNLTETWKVVVENKSLLVQDIGGGCANADGEMIACRPIQW